MLVYNYDGNTKEFINTSEAQIDIIASRRTGKNVYLLPLNATFVKVIEPQLGMARVYNQLTKAWEWIVDYRGKRAYNDNGLLVIDYIGELKGSDKLLTVEQINGLDTGTLIWQDGEIIEKPASTLEQQLEMKEDEYGMNRWQRELILAENSQASAYVKAKAQELEDLAEQIRNKDLED